MRKGNERSEMRKQKFIRIFVSLFLVMIMLTSYIAYTFTPDPSKVRYNGYTLRATVDDLGYIIDYRTKINGQEYSFYTAPADSLDISVPAELPMLLRDAPLYVVLFDPEDNLTALYDQLRFEFQEQIATPQVPGVTKPSVQYPFNTLSCANSSPDVPFILLTQGERSIYFENGCYVVQGQDYDWGLLRDRLLYLYHGVTTE